MKAVITCPHCIRAYHVKAELNGKLARCEWCGCHFGVNVVEPALPGEAFPLEGPLEPLYNFMYEACMAMAGSACEMLELAGEPYTPETLRKFVKSLPRSRDEVKGPEFKGGYAAAVMREAGRRAGLSGKPDLRKLLDYFTGQVSHRNFNAQDQLVAAFDGVLSFDFDPPTGTEVALYRRPGPLERWAARRGL